jgi:cobalt-zinc-cadmium efflux system outer membrane protein
VCRFVFCIFVLSILASGCSKAPPADDHFVTYTVANRIGSKTEWRQGCCQDVQTITFLEEAVANELTADMAIQIALLNNPKIQATFEELGIAQADLLEAGLLSNPSFEIEIRYPHSSRLHTNIEYLLTSSLLDLFLIPLRTRLASTEFEQTKLRVSNEILNLAFEVREIYYELIAEEKRVAYLQSIVELTSIISDLFTKQNIVGNVNSLEFQLAQSRFLEAELELEQSQTELIRLREKLNRLLGFPESLCLIVPKNFPKEVDYQEYDLCILETTALQERLDLQVARFEIARLSQMLGLKDWWTYTNLRAGLAGERELEGMNVIGPGFSGELPIFNYGQAAYLRLFAQLRQAQDRLAELEIMVLSEVREAHKVLMNYLKIITNYKSRLLPMQSQISISSEELYNVMGLGLDKLLENKQLEIVTNKNYTESVKKFLAARVELDRALGGFLFKLLARQECILGEDQ